MLPKIHPIFILKILRKVACMEPLKRTENKQYLVRAMWNSMPVLNGRFIHFFKFSYLLSCSYTFKAKNDKYAKTIIFRVHGTLNNHSNCLGLTEIYCFWIAYNQFCYAEGTESFPYNTVKRFPSRMNLRDTTQVP